MSNTPPRKRMNEDVPIWHDTCSCEPEARWQAVQAERENQAKPKQNGAGRESSSPRR